MGTGKRAQDITICILVAFLIMCFYLFELESWGRYVLIGVTLVVTTIFCINNNFSLPIKLCAFHSQVLLFSLYCFASGVWAWNPSLAISKGITILSILLCFSFLFIYYDYCDRVESLIFSIMLAGYGIVLYTFSFYGFASIVSVARGATRLGNDYTNINSVGMVASISCIIQYHYFLEKRYRWFSVLAIPALLMIAATQSRKALVMLVLGIFLLSMINSGNKSRAKQFLKIISACFIFFILIWSISNLSIFAGSSGRMREMFLSFGSNGQETYRQFFRRVGFEQFKKTPIFGIGMGNSAELLESVGYLRTYLHDNYIELLACGGIVGFLFYYSIYGYLAVNLWRYREIEKRNTYLCLILLFLMLIMDYGMVSYYDKQQYIYFMLCYLQINKIKRQQNAVSSRGRQTIYDAE